jgi:indole-3-glycerol phosphate synthase
MVDEYQFFEARAHGADIVLLIVAALSQEQLHDFFHLTRELGMRALVEVHTQDELERAVAIEPDIIGINSRNLKTLEVDPAVFATLLPEIPEEIIRVAESGIANSDDAHKAHVAGADTILVGEALVKDGNPELALRKMIEHG